MGSSKGSPPPAAAASPASSVDEASGADVGASPGNGPAPHPAGAVPRPPDVAPFLTKIFDMVSDPATDGVVSWAQGGGSFVVWDAHAFERDLLHQHFKHSHFTSFIRQLNTYGFRKVDPDRWEWANEGFVRGQKHLLKTIKRKKRPPQETRSELQPAPVKTAPGTENIEIGKYGGLVKEVETLKRDKALLMQQLVDLRQYQQTSSLEVQNLIQRLQVMEQNQQQMMALLAIVVQNPSFLSQLVQQQQRRTNWWNADGNKKRRFPALEHGPVSDQETYRGGAQIIQYRPPVSETSSQVIPDEALCSAAAQPVHSPAVAMPMDVQMTSNIVPETSSQATPDEAFCSTTSQPVPSSAPPVPMDIEGSSNNLDTVSSSGDLFADTSALEWDYEEFQSMFNDIPILSPLENNGQVDPPLSIQDYDCPQSEQDCQMEAQHNYKNPQYAN